MKILIRAEKTQFFIFSPSLLAHTARGWGERLRTRKADGKWDGRGLEHNETHSLSHTHTLTHTHSHTQTHTVEGKGQQ